MHNKKYSSLVYFKGMFWKYTQEHFIKCSIFQFINRLYDGELTHKSRDKNDWCMKRWSIYQCHFLGPLLLICYGCLSLRPYLKFRAKAIIVDNYRDQNPRNAQYNDQPLFNSFFNLCNSQLWIKYKHYLRCDPEAISWGFKVMSCRVCMLINSSRDFRLV